MLSVLVEKERGEMARTVVFRSVMIVS